MSDLQISEANAREFLLRAAICCSKLDLDGLFNHKQVPWVDRPVTGREVLMTALSISVDALGEIDHVDYLSQMKYTSDIPGWNEAAEVVLKDSFARIRYGAIYYLDLACVYLPLRLRAEFPAIIVGLKNLIGDDVAEVYPTYSEQVDSPYRQRALSEAMDYLRNYGW